MQNSPEYSACLLSLVNKQTFFIHSLNLNYMKTINIFNKLLCLVLMALCPVFASGQTLEHDIDFPQYTPKSPTAYSFAKYVDYPVSYYTGVPNISIPLYEISVGGLNIPISLNYHASGIMANQESTRVGLGWSLNAGGMISRTVKCGDDFQEHASPNGLAKGYFEVGEASEPISNADFFWTGKEFSLKSDSEPDLYFYSLPCSGGKFVFGKDSIPVMFDKGDHVKIRLTGGVEKVRDFEVWDTQGNLYLFNNREDTWSYGAGMPVHLNHTASNGRWDITDLLEINSFFDDPMEYVSGWYLSRIITNTNDTVEFTYADEYYQLPVQESSTKQNLLSYSGSASGGDSSFGGTRVSYSSNKTVIRSCRPTGIIWKGGRVEFGYTNRDDIVGYNNYGTPQKVSSIKVYNTIGTLIKDYAFQYDYFNSTASGSYAHLEKRLKLTGLVDRLSDNASYEFGYLSGSLPKKNTRNTDYWGYYNGSSQGASFYPPAVYDGALYTGGHKDSDINYMKRGTLETIKWPTGGTTRFIYESNKFVADSHYENRTSHNYLNIYKGIYGEHYLDFPETQTDTLVLDKRTPITLSQFFEYTGYQTIGNEGNKFGNTNYPVFTISRLNSNGSLSRLYTYPIPVEMKNGGTFQPIVDDIILDAGTYILQALQVVDEMYCEMYYGYDRMVLVKGKETAGGGLRIARIEGEKTVSYTYDDGQLMVVPVYSYLQTKNSRLGTYPFTLYSATYLMQQSESTTPMTSLKNGNIYGYGTVTETFADGSKNVYTYYNEAESASGYPFLTPEINYYNGLLDMKQTYDAAGNETRKEYYHYSNGNAGKTIYGFVYRNYGEAYPYTYYVEYPYVVQKNVVETTNGQSRDEIYNYTYNSDILPVSETLQTDGDRYINRYFYAGDFTGSGYMTMMEKNMIATPVVTLSLKDGSVVGGSKTLYGSVNGMVLPFSESLLKTSVPLTLENYSDSLEVRLHYSDYNACGHPMQTTLDGENRVYLWSYNGLYPVAEIRNATYSQVAGALGSSFITALLNKSVPTDSDISAIRALQSSLNDVEVTTYRYQPLVGVTEMTDCRGVTTGFTYDSAGRLSETWLKTSGNVETLSTYEYNYAQ